MKISKLNPIGYEAKTEKGNTYQKSNLGATTGALAFAVLDSTPYIFKNNAKVKTAAKLFSTSEILPALFKSGSKMVKPLKALGFAIDIICGLTIGNLIDKTINKKRAAKADALAETQKLQDAE